MIPTQVFIDGEGKIAGTHIGLLKKEELLQRLERYDIASKFSKYYSGRHLPNI